MKPPVYTLAQQRGQWFCKARGARSIAALGTGRLAVIRDWDNGMLEWASRPPRYTEQAEDGWWDHPASATWRALLRDGAAVWVRKVKQDGTGVGRSAGIWRIGEVERSDRRVSFALTQRIGDTK